MPITLRPAVESDFEACRRTYFAEHGWIDERLQLDHASQELTLRRLWNPAQVGIIQLDGVDVGWLQTLVSEKECFVGQLFIDRAFQRCGIGTAVLGRVIAEASSQGVPVRLAVVKFNPCRRLYERLGFRVTHEDDRKVYMRRDPD